MDEFLSPVGAGKRPHHAQGQLQRFHAVERGRARALFEAGPQNQTDRAEQPPGIGPVIGDQIRAGQVFRGKHRLAERDRVADIAI